VRCPALLTSALVILFCAATARGTDKSEDAAALNLEYKIKAGFLYNFAKFVEWPTNVAGASGLLKIGVLDDGPAYAIIAGELSRKQLGNSAIEVIRCKSGDDLKQCAVVFVTRTQAGRFKELKKAVAGVPVLTVGEFDRFAARGGCINFVRKGENIRFEVNLEAAEQAGLKISSKISAVAIVVRTEEDEP
jgi:hypothetical protein